VPGLPFRALQKVSLLIAEEGPAKPQPPVSSTPLKRRMGRCEPLSGVARVRLGIVTGGKSFFVLRRRDKKVRSLKRHLVPVVSTPSQLRGLVVLPGDCDLLLRVRSRPDASLRKLIAAGEAAGIAARYKCRIRDPWYAVPEQAPPDAFLSYLAGEIPRLALNRAGARATNNLHAVWWTNRAEARTLAFHNWLTLLSIERIGRVYGGGVIKIEPGDAPRILLPPPGRPRRGLFAWVDGALRRGNWKEAVDRVTEWLVPRPIAGAARSEWRELRALR
jgi:hypothetical protein